MNDEYASPRDVDNDLAEITSRLGEPDATYRTNVRSVAWRFVLGVVIVLAAAGLHYVMWTGEVPWPKGRHWKLWALILAGMFIGPGIGLYLITFAVRGLKLWVLAYPNGLFIWHRGRVVSFPWDEIAAVQISGLPPKGVLNCPPGPNGLPESVWYDLTKAGGRVFGTTITLTRTDVEQVALSSTLNDFPDLGERIQRESYKRLFPGLWAEFRAGRELVFGPVKCDDHGITVGKKTLRWRELDSLDLAGDKLEVKQKGKKKAWAKCDHNSVVNLHILMGVAAAMRPSHDTV